MFLDESGDHSLTAIDPSYPVFVLAGVVTDFKYAFDEMETAVKRFKREFFGRDDVILHTADIVRSQGDFELLRDREVRDRVFKGLNRLVRGLDFKVVACVIRKDAHVARYGTAAFDPYFFSLDVVVERFVFEVAAGASPGLVIAEKRDPTLDRQLDLAWERLKTSGTRYLRAAQVTRAIAEVVHWEKRSNVAGLQLADLVASPIGRFVLGRKVYEDFRIIETKFRRDKSGNYRGPGLVVLPRVEK